MADFLGFEKNIDALSVQKESNNDTAQKTVKDIADVFSSGFDHEFFRQTFSIYKIPAGDAKQELRNISSN